MDAGSAPLASPRKLDVAFDQRGLSDALCVSPRRIAAAVWAYGYAGPNQLDHDRSDSVMARRWAVHPAAGRRNAMRPSPSIGFPTAATWCSQAINTVPVATCGWRTTSAIAPRCYDDCWRESAPSVRRRHEDRIHGRGRDFDLLSIPNNGGPPQPLRRISKRASTSAYRRGTECRVVTIETGHFSCSSATDH